jgi:translation initiation factor IF-3
MNYSYGCWHKQVEKGFICFIYFSEVFCINKDQVQINSLIRDKEVRLIDADGTMIGVMSAREAQLKANERELDLVKISPNANPPVCKIMDYGKFVYEQNKKDKEAKKKQTIIELKEIRLSAKIEDHDFNFKSKNAIKFLEDGDKVKISIRFRGREISYSALGREVMEKFADTVKEYGKVEKPPVMEGRTLSMILVPIKK